VIPREHAAWVIDRCYWPVLELLDREPGVRFGVEFSGDTLETIATVDETLIDALRRLAQRGRLELLGSGYVQSILPLLPARANGENLRLGAAAYAGLLGRAPTIAYANEQSFSAGTLDVYRDAGYRAVVLEWENVARVADLPPQSRYHPRWAHTASGGRIPVLWNSSVAFQKLQRYLHSALTLEEYIAFLGSHWSADEERALCFYGSDWEVIDYRPGAAIAGGEAGTPGPEHARLAELLGAIVRDARFAWATPSEILDRFPPRETSALTAAECPVPTKKQPKYTLTRWAVCGRDNARWNARCHRLHRSLTIAEALARALRVEAAAAPLRELWRDATRLWGSDFRTMATDDKRQCFAEGLGHALGRARELLGRLSSMAAPALGFTLFNPGPGDWGGVPVTIRVGFRPGRFRALPGLRYGEAGPGHVLPHQWEEVEHYRDGSVRRALAVLCPRIAAADFASITFAAPVEALAPGAALRLDAGAVRGEHVAVEFQPRRGGAIETLRFPHLASRPLAGTLAHGYFDAIDLSPDWYTGHVVLFDRAGEKLTDLEPARTLPPVHGREVETLPVRVAVRFEVSTPAGIIQKTYYVYRDQPRLDLRYRFCLEDFQPWSARIGVLTLNPEAFDPERLSYSVVNGGAHVETFRLRGRRVAHDEAVSPTVTSRTCAGASEGWIATGDDRKGVAVVGDLSRCATVPLVRHEEALPGAFTRIYTSIAEGDVTARHFWRGQGEVGLTLFGYRSIGEARDLGVAINTGLWLAPGRDEEARLALEGWD
jgi:hypothetical protein